MVHCRKLFPPLKRRSCNATLKTLLILQPIGDVKACGIALAAAVSANPVDLVRSPLSRMYVANGSKWTVEAKQTAVKNSLQAAKNLAAEDTAAEKMKESQEERRVAALEAQAAAALRSAVAAERSAAASERSATASERSAAAADALFGRCEIASLMGGR
jgi:hypothetical protein